MNKVIYVTGCLGFIGAFVTEECLKKGWYVTGVDKITYAAQPWLIKKFSLTYKDHFRFIQTDINDLDRICDCDYIINTAAETHVDNSIISSHEFLRSNIDGVHRLLELIRTKRIYKLPTLLHFSTDEVYGDIVEGSHTEKDILKPSNPYSATKAAADMLVLAWARTFNIPYVIIRPTNNYGVGQYVEKLIPKTCQNLILGRKIPLHLKGSPKRVWLHARDTAQAVITLIEAGVRNEIYNVSGTDEVPNIEIVTKIVKLMTGEDDPSPYLDFSYNRSGGDLRYSLDDSKLKALGWSNQCFLDKELPDVVEYYKSTFVW
jgi:dTDP-glucose 4,6-dehydratase